MVDWYNCLLYHGLLHQPYLGGGEGDAGGKPKLGGNHRRLGHRWREEEGKVEEWEVEEKVGGRGEGREGR